MNIAIKTAHTDTEARLKNLIASKGGILHVPGTVKITGTLEREGEAPISLTATVHSLQTVLAEDISVEFYGGYSTKWKELTDEEKEAIAANVFDRYMEPASGNESERYQLRRLNLGFIREHGDLDESDFKRMAVVKAAIENARMLQGNAPYPLPGDSVEGAYYNGGHPFKDGMLDTPYDWYEKDEVSLCAGPYSPFTSLSNTREEGYSFSMSGGPFFRMKASDLEYIGTDRRLFTVWGHNGACGNGAIRFYAKINRWRVKNRVNY